MLRVCGTEAQRGWKELCALQPGNEFIFIFGSSRAAQRGTQKRGGDSFLVTNQILEISAICERQG
jgi:hypothetical protein